MYFHELQPAPLDLPEIIDRIRAHLSLTDIRKCVLISSIWNKMFRPFLWETMYYNRFSDPRKDFKGDDPLLSRNGQLVRELFTFGLDDQDMRMIAKYCSRLHFFHLEIARMTEINSFRNLFNSLQRLQRLVLKISNAKGRSPIQRIILDPIANGALRRLTELQIVGLESFQTVPAYQSGMILRCLEGCPSLHTLELGSIRIVDTEQEWLDAINNPLSSLIRPRQDLNNAMSLPAEVIQELQTLNTTPDPEFKTTSIKVLRLWKIYAETTVADTFAQRLGQRCPNVTVLSLTSAPSGLNTLATDCPRLEFLTVEQSGYPNRPFLGGFLTRLSPRLRRLCFRECSTLTDAMLSENVTTALTQQGLMSLEITKCGGISIKALARFLARCHTLENVRVDRLLVRPGSYPTPGRWPSRPRGEHMTGPSVPPPSPVGSQVLQPIQWQCLGLRYLDVYGIEGCIDTFENLLLDLLPRLENLEFLGMRTQHVDWLMGLEPFRDIHGNVIDITEHHQIPPTLAKGILPRLTIMFGSITTLSLDPVDRRGDRYGDRSDIHINSQYSDRKAGHLLTLKHVKYLYCMFPKLQRIVYNGSSFPCTRDAWDWLGHPKVVSPPKQHHTGSREPKGRTVEVVYRSREEADATFWKY